MDTHQEIKLRQAIWAEYRSESDKSQVRLNLIENFGSEIVSDSKIDQWYSHFESGKTSLFEQNDIASAIQILSNGDEKDIVDSILFLYKEEGLYYKTYTSDGRHMVDYVEEVNKDDHIVFHDMFRGEKKEFPIISDSSFHIVHSVKLISYDYILLCSDSELALLKIDFDSKKATVISKIDHNYELEEVLIIMDEVDRNHFLISDRNETIIISIVDDKIVIDRSIEEYQVDLQYPKLVGNKLMGFDVIKSEDEDGTDKWLCQYIQVDLNNLAEIRSDVPLNFTNWDADLNFSTETYCWSGSVLYVNFHDYPAKNQDSIYSFDTETMIWSDIGTRVYGIIEQIFVDDEHFLTLKATSIDNVFRPTYYRFALKKPEKLKNIAWMTIRRNAILFGGKDYEEIRDRFVPSIINGGNSKKRLDNQLVTQKDSKRIRFTLEEE